jgi:3-phenylpropionate/trans-cinnamate dioxygenase ferredoxin subunit
MEHSGVGVPEFKKLAELNSLKNFGVTKVELEGHLFAVVRFDSEVYVLDDRCSHQDYSLSEGEVDRDEMTLECYKHGSTFSLIDGHPTCLPAKKPVRVYQIKVEDSTVLIDL